MAMTKPRRGDSTPIEQLAYSRAQFCLAAGNLSKQRFYDLLRSGEGPETFMIGRRRMVLAVEARRWIKQKAAEHKTTQKAIKDAEITAAANS